MRRSERSSYTPIDFVQWHEAGTLVISPKFQRRGVWNRAARSYLIDTLLLGLPVPPIYIRVTQDVKRRSVIREIVDGQQRVSAILDYMNDKFTLGKNIESPCAGKRFKNLTEQEQDRISQYSFVCEVFYGVEDDDILRVFSRLNTYSVRLNDQELRNGQYFGDFKQSVYKLALEHLAFWRNNKLFSETGIARMNEVELTSELVILMIDGIQDKKKSINKYYAKFEEAFEDREVLEGRFRFVIDSINDAMKGEGLSGTEFRRVPLFYSLFGAVYDKAFGMPRDRITQNPRGRISADEIEQLGDAIHTLSDALASAKEPEGADGVAPAFEDFVLACLRQTDNLKPRRTRLETIYKVAFG
ncbi:DUF262 domain-containing protein [Phenylobacterium sp. LH3H17]|uniref:DUF262 domain-containing protein n=1 Tax=Phenylobacterium sp. LH3H17 TaxID=2903901 RepID=UPI0020C9AFF8|nr:DUF262 domain-containing protein [Phenylobacterium sp. LH3H17]UTP40076.1 DUF262 domain-containing protein [Phenylobacterium sp. LH3H17]